MKRWLARKLLHWAGWTIEGERPVAQRYVLIAAPHTSNWDFPLMLAFAAAFDIRINWMGKHALFFPPLGWVLRFMGGIPIVRHKSTNVVAAMISSFADRQELVLVVPVEGTRALADFWKSGFYYIARGAGVPIVPSYLDFAAKRGGFGAAIEASGNIDKDMQYLRDFYAPMQGKHPALSGPIRLREESAE